MTIYLTENDISDIISIIIIASRSHPLLTLQGEGY